MGPNEISGPQEEVSGLLLWGVGYYKKESLAFGSPTSLPCLPLPFLASTWGDAAS